MVYVFYTRAEMMAIPEPKVVQLSDGVYTVFTEDDAHLPPITLAVPEAE